MTRSALDTAPRSRLRIFLTTGALVLVAAAIALAIALTRSTSPGLDKRVCAYSSHRVSVLEAFSHKIGRDVSCAVVFNDASLTWAQWASPWFLTHPNPDMNWANWLRSGHGRQLIITQNLFPSSLKGTDWLDPGARGAFTGYAKALARNLVRAGAGSAVIRLAHEANGTWYPDSVGTSPSQLGRWREFWRKTALAMKSVPGAHFKFDWTVNAGVRAIPLGQFYPGDDVTDIVGVDAYDVGVPAGPHRWRALYDKPGGIGEVVRFARVHHKPLSIPEWGLGPTGGKQSAGGDDPAYVDGIAGVVRRNDVAYQAYFYSGQWQAQLDASPRSVAAYRHNFGTGGDSAP